MAETLDAYDVDTREKRANAAKHWLFRFQNGVFQSLATSEFLSCQEL